MKKTFTTFSLLACASIFAQTNFSAETLDPYVRDMAGNIETSTVSAESNRIMNFNYGFEVSQGFYVGTINGQNGWTVTSGGAAGPLIGQDVTTELFNEGAQSLKVSQDNRFPAQVTTTGASNPIVGAFHNLGALTMNNIEFYINPSIDQTTIYQIGTVNSTLGQWRDQFRIDSSNGASIVANWEEGYYRATTATFSSNTWYKINIVYNQAGGTIQYKVDDAVVYTRSNVPAANFEYNELRFTHDNKALTSKMFIDAPANLAVGDIASKTQISVYPNPASDVVYINNNSGEKIESISLGDITGRTIKYLKNNDTKIDLQGLSKGVYILKVKTDKGLSIQKVIKK